MHAHMDAITTVLLAKKSPNPVAFSSQGRKLSPASQPDLPEPPNDWDNAELSYTSDSVPRCMLTPSSDRL